MFLLNFEDYEQHDVAVIYMILSCTKYKHLRSNASINNIALFNSVSVYSCRRSQRTLSIDGNIIHKNKFDISKGSKYLFDMTTVGIIIQDLEHLMRLPVVLRMKLFTFNDLDRLALVLLQVTTS